MTTGIPSQDSSCLSNLIIQLECKIAIIYSAEEPDTSSKPVRKDDDDVSKPVADVTNDPFPSTSTSLLTVCRHSLIQKSCELHKLLCCTWLINDILCYCADRLSADG